MKKRRESYLRGVALIFLTILILTATSLYSNKTISGNVVLNPEIPKNCSNESIKSLWESVFTESSNDIQIYAETSTTGRCDNVVAYKIKPDNILFALIEDYDDFSSSIQNSISLVKMNASPSTASNLRLATISESIPMLTNLDLYSNATNRSISLTQADSEIVSNFKVEPSTWLSKPDSSEIVYTFNYTENPSENLNRTVFSNVYGNHSALVILITQKERVTCIPKWIPQNLSCNSTEKMDTWFTYLYNCPESGNPPENTTTNCNYDNNSVFGDLKDFESKSVNKGFSDGLLVYIDGNLANITTISSGSKKVEIKTTNQTYVEFSWDFSTPLDISSIEVERESSGGIGYTIVKGLSNVNKTIILDSLIDTNEICIRNDEISSVGAISIGCSKPDEIRLACPQSKGKISCEFEGGYFKIYGLNNSGAKEINLSEEGEEVCTPNWNCTVGECINNSQTNTCVDLNNCNSVTDKPAENQPCGEFSTLGTTSCISNWNCTEWSVCDNSSNRTRNCIDQNSCEGNKVESEQCENPKERTKRTIYLTAIIVIIALIIIVTVILIAQFARHK